MASITIDQADGLASSVAIKGPVLLCSTTNVALLAGEQTIDGTLTASSRVLLTGQTNPIENGIYVTDAGDWRRAADFSRNNDVRRGTVVYVTDGAANSGNWYVSTADAAVNIDGAAINFIPQRTALAALLSAYVAKAGDTMTGSLAVTVGAVNASTTQFDMLQGGAAAHAALTDTNITNTADFYFSGNYQAAA